MIKEKIQKSIITVLSALLLFSCLRPAEKYEPPEMVKEIIPNSEGTSSSKEMYELDSFDPGSQKPVIKLGSNEVLINTINLNLDLDSSEEQIIIIKDRDMPEGKITIVVADYDNVENKYIRSWQSSTGASNIRSFIVYLDDLIGDHNNEIVCSGRDANGNSTLDIFWKNNSSSNSLLSYLSIFNISEKGTIEIIQQSRSRAYQQGLKDGVSYPITVTREEGTASESIDLIQSKYYWDFPLKRYVKLTEEKLESTEIIERQLTEILDGDEQGFYNYINGPWISESREKDDNELIIYFNPDMQTATFYTGDIQENYTWANSYKVLSNLLYIRCRNEIINYIENEIFVKINGIDEITITVKDIDSQTRVKAPNDIWSMKYRRLNSTRLNETIKTIESVSGLSDLPILTGQYISDSGDVMEFYGSEFQMRTSYNVLSGGFAVYSADIDILDLKIINEAGIVYDTRTFALDFSEIEKDRTIERTLILTPGKLSIYGFKASNTVVYRLVQIETLEIPADDISGNQ
ncbi:MAG: pallilysin-related adhesin [Spirochaetales bacterium]|nr:pallilysin-related adhesin [Spirochaetales bacterium]